MSLDHGLAGVAEEMRAHAIAYYYEGQPVVGEWLWHMATVTLHDYNHANIPDNVRDMNTKQTKCIPQQRNRPGRH